MSASEPVCYQPLQQNSWTPVGYSRAWPPPWPTFHFVTNTWPKASFINIWETHPEHAFFFSRPGPTLDQHETTSLPWPSFDQHLSLVPCSRSWQTPDQKIWKKHPLTNAWPTNPENASLDQSLAKKVLLESKISVAIKVGTSWQNILDSVHPPLCEDYPWPTLDKQIVN